MKNKLFIILFLSATTLCLPAGAFAQDPLFTQYFSAPIYYNPAFTGIATGVRARFNFRNQWPQLPVSYKAYYFSADIGDRNLPGAGGLGLMINSDNEGVGFIKNFEAALTLGVRIPITSFVVAQVGIKASVKQKTINWDDFVVSDQLSEKYGLIYTSAFTRPDANKRVFPDFAVGGLVQFSNETGNFTGTVGMAVDHVFQPDESFLGTTTSPLPRKWVGHLDLVITATGTGSSSLSSSHGMDEALKLNPGVIFISQAKQSNIEAGLTLMKFNIYLGGWYKGTFGVGTSNSLALMAGYRYLFAEDMSIKFMYNYDLPISGAMMGTGGAHEISLVLEFSKISIFGGRGGFSSPGRNRGGYEPLDCPVFY